VLLLLSHFMFLQQSSATLQRRGKSYYGYTLYYTRNSSGDEIANVNFL